MLANREKQFEKRDWLEPCENKRCRVLFVTNYLSLHQVGIWDELALYDDIDFIFLRTGSLTDEDAYPLLADHRRYSCNSHNDFPDVELARLIDQADFIIRGSVEDVRVSNILKEKSAAYAYEHISKERSLRGLVSWVKAWALRRYTYSKADMGLCMSSHVAFDFFLKGMSPHRMWKFGYFPHLEYASLDDFASKDPFSLIYVGRLIELKHPELALYALKELKRFDGRWHLDFYGEGPLQSDIERKAEALGFFDADVVFHGFIDPSKTKSVYQSASYFVFPSDHREGWGAVLSEAMAQGCICFANSMAGSSTFLIRSGVNGYLFKSKNGLLRQLRHAVRLSEKRLTAMRSSAISTMKSEWSGRVAARRLHDFIAFGSENAQCFHRSGPCSKSFSIFGFVQYIVNWIASCLWQHNSPHL